jgi:hypothetical protein
MIVGCALFYTRVIIFKKSLELELNKVFEQVIEVSTHSFILIYRQKKTRGIYWSRSARAS